jgi:hypothetical protein
MTAANRERNLQEIGNRRYRTAGVKANLVIYAGTIAAIDSAGLAIKAITATTGRVLGVFRKSINTTGLADGAVTAEMERGCFGPFANSAAGDQITAADLGTTCYVVDDQTVAKTSGSSTRVAAGLVWSVGADGVYVDFQ